MGLEIWRRASIAERVQGVSEMRITFVVASIDHGGGFRVIAMLARQLTARGHDVTLVCPQPAQPGLKQRIKAWLAGKRIERPEWRSDYLEGMWHQVRIADHSAPLRAVDFPDADVIIATWWRTMRWIENLPAAKGVKVHLVQDHEIWPPNPRDEVDAVLRIKSSKIAISRYLQKLMHDGFGHADVHLLSNAVDHSQFHAEARDKSDPITVGFTYSPDLHKGSDLILRAVTRAREAIPGLRVLAFGHGAPQEPVPMPACVEYHPSPAQSALRTFYARCDAWLFGSRAEGFGLPILEAMACRTPVIGMPAGAAPDLLADGCGLLVPDQDWEAMARAIVTVSEMPPAQWRALSERAYRRARDHNWDDNGAKLERILGEIVAGR